MPTTRSLRSTFRQAVATAMMWTPGLVAGCRDVGPGIEDDPNFVPVRCEGGQARWLEDLSPEPPVDFLGLATQSFQTSRMYTERVGEPCRTASDVGRCQTTLSLLPGADFSAPTRPSFTVGSYADHVDIAVLHATRGDDAFSVTSVEELRAFLGEVNTAGEAALLVQASGYNVTCEEGGARPSADGFQVQAFRYFGCGGRDRFLIAVSSAGAIERLSRVRLSEAERNCEVGRRPPGLCLAPAPRARSAGQYLARACTLEAASVEAFLRLAAELKAHGAPHRLIAAARSAARDEVRHARVTARLAQRFGAVPQRPQVEPMPLRELEAIALENAQEGCVRETFGALEARWQAAHAAEPALRRAYTRIAEDELRHAALAWRIARWSEPALSARARRRVQQARRAAIAELRRELAIEPAPDVQRRCGVPSARAAQVLFECLSAHIA
jgi:hypothetical protein